MMEHLADVTGRVELARKKIQGKNGVLQNKLWGIDWLIKNGTIYGVKSDLVLWWNELFYSVGLVYNTSMEDLWFYWKGTQWSFQESISYLRLRVRVFASSVTATRKCWRFLCVCVCKARGSCWHAVTDSMHGENEPSEGKNSGN